MVSQHNYILFVKFICVDWPFVVLITFGAQQDELQ
jgi:hypothetical protein